MSRPGFRAFFSNFWSSDEAILERLRLAAKNTAIKARNGSDCCGNHGEPGC